MPSPDRRAALRRLALFALLILMPACREGSPAETSGGGPRVVALSPGVAETLRALGLGETLVGRHAFDDATPQSVPSVGDQSGIDYEALLRLRPTHVLLERSAAGAPPRLLELAAARGFAVHEIPMLTLAEIRDAIATLPSVVGAPEAEAAAEALLAQLDRALRVRPAFREGAGRMLVLYWTDPIGAAGPGSYHAEIVEALGGSLALSEGRPYVQLDAEDVRRLDPDSILLILPGADPRRVHDLLGPLASLDLRAVRDGRVGLITHPRGQTPGPTAIHVAVRMREIVLAWPPLTEP